MQSIARKSNAPKINWNIELWMIAKQLVEYNDELQENPKLTLYEKQLKETEKAIENLLNALEKGIFNQSTQDRMLKLESEKADLLFRIDGEKLNIPLKLDLSTNALLVEIFCNWRHQ